MKGVIGVVLLTLNLNNLDQFIMSLKRQNIKKIDIFFLLGLERKLPTNFRTEHKQVSEKISFDWFFFFKKIFNRIGEDRNKTEFLQPNVQTTVNLCKTELNDWYIKGV